MGHALVRTTGQGSAPTPAGAAGGADLFVLDGVAVSLVGDLVDREVLERVDLTLPRGSITHVLGASGVGKTTLLRLLDRLVEPTAGRVLFEGAPLAERDPVTHRRDVALVPQVPLMLPGTVRANIEAPLRLHRERRLAPAIEEAAWRLHQLGFDGAFLEEDAQRLSVGERQRVSLVRALMTHPRVLLLDEATAGLDPATAALVLAGLERLNRDDGVTLVHASHRLDHVRALGGTLVFLSEGRVRELGPVSERLDAPVTPALGAFLRMLPAPRPGSRSA